MSPATSVTTAPMEEAEQRLWVRCRGGDERARADLVERHLGLVYYAAHHAARRLPAGVVLDDLVSAGTLGLLQAVDRFEPARGLAFSTFALPRIRGALLDDRRATDTLPRTIRARLRALQQTRDTLAQRLGRPAAPHEVADALGVPVAQLWAWEQDIEQATPTPLAALRDGADPAVGPREPAAPDTMEALDAQWSRDVEHEALRAALETLKEKERAVLMLYYFEGLKMAQIAAALGVTEGRVSQLRTAALARLRGALSPRDDVR